MDYDVEADWQLLNTCNYRCTYCFFSAETLGEKLKVHASHDEWGEAFDRTGLKWLLHITGGEPSVYPGFVDLCERLTRRHALSINSNMTQRSWEEFAKRVDPRRVSFINAGLHLAEREHRNGNDAFLKNVDLLRQRGFQVMTSLVATPESLRRFEEAIKLVAAVGMFPIPKLLRGKLEGKSYPRAYTSAERQQFHRYNEMAREFYQPMLSDHRTEKPTIDMLGDAVMLHGTPKYKGLSCDAGRLFFSIEPDGSVQRCGVSRSYQGGNLLKGTFARNQGASRCDTSYCFYFCEKYCESQPMIRTAFRSVRVAGQEARRMLIGS